MKKQLLSIFLLFVFSCGILFFLPNSTISAQETEKVYLYLFYGTGCPHCAKEREYIQEIKGRYEDSIIIEEFEVYYNSENGELFNQILTELNINTAAVPFLIVGEKYLVGFESAETTGLEIGNEIERCLDQGCMNALQKVENNEDTLKDSNIEEGTESNNTSPMYLKTPIFGNIDLKSVSLPVATIIIAFVDGFNPCAMWILIFLITMLINMKDKKKLYTLGTIFIVTSALIYFVFLTAWFNFFRLIGFVTWIKLIIGIIAIVAGIYQLHKAFFSKGECKATNKEQRKNIMDRIKKIVAEKSFALSAIGIMALAVSVNLIEVVCSAGLPAIYTNLLSTINLNIFEYYMYLILYIFVFMLDDLFVFFMAIKTFEVTGIAKKYTKFSGIIGGILLLIIGIILIIKPELLMFG